MGGDDRQYFNIHIDCNVEQISETPKIYGFCLTALLFSNKLVVVASKCDLICDNTVKNHTMNLTIKFVCVVVRFVVIFPVNCFTCVVFSSEQY